MELTLNELFHLGQYAIDAVESPTSEVDIKPQILENLKNEVTITKRMMNAKIPQDHPELNKIVSYFKNHQSIVDEVLKKPLINLDIEFTLKFIASNQKRINEILRDT